MPQLAICEAGSACPLTPSRAGRYGLTVICIGTALNLLRKHMFTELQARGLRVSRVIVSRAEEDRLASLAVTFTCPAPLHASMTQLLDKVDMLPGVQSVRWDPHPTLWPANSAP